MAAHSREEDFGGYDEEDFGFVYERAGGGGVLVDERDDLGWIDFGGTSGVAVAEVGFHRSGSGFEGGGLVADGAFEVGEDGEGVPRCGDVAEGFVAFDGAVNFAAGFVETTELDELVGDVAAKEPLVA